MIVRLRHHDDNATPHLTRGQEYAVIGIEADDYRLLNDRGEPCLYPPERFDIVAPEHPVNWEEKPAKKESCTHTRRSSIDKASSRISSKASRRRSPSSGGWSTGTSRPRVDSAIHATPRSRNPSCVRTRPRRLPRRPQPAHEPTEARRGGGGGAHGCRGMRCRVMRVLRGGNPLRQSALR